MLRQICVFLNTRFLDLVTASHIQSLLSAIHCQVGIAGHMEASHMYALLLAHRTTDPQQHDVECAFSQDYAPSDSMIFDDSMIQDYTGKHELSNALLQVYFVQHLHCFFNKDIAYSIAECATPHLLVLQQGHDLRGSIAQRSQSILLPSYLRSYTVLLISKYFLCPVYSIEQYWFVWFLFLC